MDTRETLARIEESGVVAVLRGIDEDAIVPVAKAMHQGGVRAIEVTADAPRASDMVADVDRALEDTNAVVGAGTVLDGATARSVIEAGAEFVLAPDLNPEVITTCNRHGALSVPGIMTPTEAVRALETGADVLKMFPASTVGPDHVGALRGPLGDVPIVPTGGVDTDNVAEFFDAGAIAVGAGSAIVDYDAVERLDWEGVRDRAAEFVEAVETARK